MNTFEKTWLKILICTHAAILVFFLPYLVYLQVASLETAMSWPDFTVYYAAGHMALFKPGALYDTQAYQSFYATLRGGFTPRHWLGFLAPPTMAFAFAPLSLLSFRCAFIFWTAVNVAACLLIARQIALLAEKLGLRDLKYFLGSCIFAVMATAVILMRGQLSLVVCLAFIGFLNALAEGKPLRAGLLLALLLQVKPQLFLPFLLCLAGARQWRIAFAACGASLIAALATLPIVGIEGWLDYLALLRHYSASRMDVGRYLHLMLSLEGWLFDLFGSGSMGMATLIYLAFCAACFVCPLIMKARAGMMELAILAPFAFFAATYFQTHDLILLLPVAVVFTRALRDAGQARWMMLCYILAGYLGAAAPLWSMRLLPLVFCVIAVYLMIRRGQGSKRATIGDP